MVIIFFFLGLFSATHFSIDFSESVVDFSESEVVRSMISFSEVVAYVTSWPSQG